MLGRDRIKFRGSLHGYKILSFEQDFLRNPQHYYDLDLSANYLHALEVMSYEAISELQSTNPNP